MRTFIIVTLLALVAGVGIGFGMGWLRVQSVPTPDPDKSAVELTIDKGKIKEDAKALGEATFKTTQKVGEAVTDIVTTKRLTVTLIDINSPERFIKGYGMVLDEHTFQVTAATRVRRQDRDIILENLQLGETVEVVYTVEAGHNIAKSITAN